MASGALDVDPASGTTHDSAKEQELRYQQLMFQYDQLRKEILQNQSTSTTITGFALAACAALLGTAIGANAGTLLDIQRALFMLAAGGIVLVAMLETIREENATARIASYIRECVEPGLPEVKWETRLAKLNRGPITSSTHWLLNRLGLGLLSYNPLNVYGGLSLITNLGAIVYACLSLASAFPLPVAGLSVLEPTAPLRKIVFAVVIIALAMLSLVFAALLWRWQRDWGRAGQKYDDLWRKVGASF